MRFGGGSGTGQRMSKQECVTIRRLRKQLQNALDANIQLRVEVTLLERRLAQAIDERSPFPRRLKLRQS